MATSPGGDEAVHVGLTVQVTAHDRDLLGGRPVLQQGAHRRLGVLHRGIHTHHRTRRLTHPPTIPSSANIRWPIYRPCQHCTRLPPLN
ncbi:MAG: hypothetical protein ACREQ5_02080 [Candidatus Dormibacteria bacterium]